MAQGIVLAEKSVAGSVGPTNPLPVRIKDGVTGNDKNLVEAPTTLTIYNVVLTNADQEYSQALPAGTKKYKIYAMDSVKRYPHGDTLKYTNVSGASGTTFIPIPPMGYDLVENVNLTGTTLYFQSPTGSAVVIIVCWT